MKDLDNIFLYFFQNRKLPVFVDVNHHQFFMLKKLPIYFLSEINCELPRHPENGYVALIGSMEVTIRCHTGYILEEDRNLEKTLTCFQNGTLINPVPDCTGSMKTAHSLTRFLIVRID